eukprot:3558-Heterococcus_DN1.PRE.3
MSDISSSCCWCGGDNSFILRTSSSITDDTVSALRELRTAVDSTTDSNDVTEVVLAEGVDYVRSTTVKDQIELSGNDLSTVSNTAARIAQACTVKNKDIRKFLDVTARASNATTFSALVKQLLLFRESCSTAVYNDSGLCLYKRAVQSNAEYGVRYSDR